MLTYLYRCRMLAVRLLPCADIVSHHALCAVTMSIGTWSCLRKSPSIYLRGGFYQKSNGGSLACNSREVMRFSSSFSQKQRS